MTERPRAPTLLGWCVRDTAISLFLGLTLWGCHAWYAETASALSAILGALLGFVTAYVVCYVCHEWGHLIAARSCGSHMPLAPYAGVPIGTFDIASHSRRQFLWLSWGGVLAYVVAASCFVVAYAMFDLAWVGVGVAVGGAAFVVQSLAVDLPQILRVSRGADIAATSAAGANAAIILRRTWQTWVPLAVVVAIWTTLLVP